MQREDGAWEQDDVGQRKERNRGENGALIAGTSTAASLK